VIQVSRLRLILIECFQHHCGQAIAWSSVDSWPIFDPPSDERPKQKRVLVVNPKAAELKDRYAELFGEDITLVVKSFKDWFSSENYGNCK